MRKLYFLFIVLFCGLKTTSFTQTASPLELYDTTDYVIMPTSYLEVLVDEKGELSNQEVTSGKFEDKFVPFTSISKAAAIEKLGAVYWIRFRLISKSGEQRRYIFENMDQHIDEFSLFILNEESKKYDELKAGYLNKFGVRSYRHKNFIFDLPVKQKNPDYIYVKARSHIHDSFFFKIQTSTYFAYYSLNEYYLLGIFYGIMLIMGLYNLMLYFQIKEKVYILYFFYVLSCIILTFAEDGLGFQYLWGNSPSLNLFFGDFKDIIFLISLMFYSVVFLDLKKRAEKLWKLVYYITFGYSLYYILIFFAVSDPQLSDTLRSALKIVPFVVIYYAAIKVYRTGYTAARYYIIGYSIIFISIVFLILRESGIIHWGDIYSFYSFNFGLVIETVMLSFALGDRIRQIKEDREKAQEKIILQLEENEKLKDKVNRELEEQVKQRTIEIEEKAEELEEANQKLLDQAEEINKMNVMLDLQNRKLQNNVKKISTDRVMSRKVDLGEFNNIYPNKESCLKYLAELKWEDDYKCRKCNHDKHCRGKTMYSRRCTRCRYDESATAYTIFHRLKFPITKAFYIVFLLYDSKEKITSSELSQRLELRQSTCWNFSKKVQDAIDGSKKKKKTGNKEGWGAIVLESE